MCGGNEIVDIEYTFWCVYSNINNSSLENLIFLCKLIKKNIHGFFIKEILIIFKVQTEQCGFLNTHASHKSVNVKKIHAAKN